MSTRRLLLSSVFAFALASPLALPVFAQDAVTGESADNSTYRVDGIINTNSVLVRSGMGENFYPTEKLDKGSKITVVGMKYDWLKIIPPEGSFCYVAKAYVEKRGDGSVGRVTKDSINVRAGSSLNSVKITVLCQLREGEDVQILGEEDEYFKIKPPTDAFLYVNKQFVDIDPTSKPQKQDVAAGDGTNAPAQPDQAQGAQPPTAVAPQTGAAATAAGPTSQPGDVAVVPTTQPAVDPAIQAQADYDTAETAFEAASKQALLDQPLADLQTQFQALSKNNSLPESLHRIVDARLLTLNSRVDAQKTYQDVVKSQDELKQKQVALKAEQDELQQRLAASGVEIFTAVGTLQPSSLQQGQITLYRLTDPASGRTVIYLRTNDTKVVSFLGQFVGVKGDIASDDQLGVRVIAPTDMEAVDPSKVNNGVNAQLVPPSMMPKSPEASASN